MRRLLAAAFLTVCAIGMAAPTASAAGTADLSIKIVGPLPAPGGEPSVTYQVTVSNIGPDAATGSSLYLPVITRLADGKPYGLGFAPRSWDSRCSYPGDATVMPEDVLSAVTCAVGDLPSGSSTTFSITGDLLFGPDRTVYLLPGNETDPSQDNNSASAEAPPIPMIDPAVGAGGAAASLIASGVIYHIRRGTVKGLPNADVKLPS